MSQSALRSSLHMPDRPCSACSALETDEFPFPLVNILQIGLSETDALR